MSDGKTNAVRMLEKTGAVFTVHTYTVDDGRVDALTVAEKLGVAPERLFKTLVTVGADRGHYVFMIPAANELDLKRAARAAGVKSVAMLPTAALFPLTGYVHGGCSPLGMKKAFPTFVEELAVVHDTIVFSAGRVGMNLEMNPEQLARVTGAFFAPLVRD